MSSAYWNIIWGFFILLGTAVFVLGIGLMIKRGNLLSGSPWRKGEPESEEIQYLLERGILKIHPDHPNQYFSASLWDTEETAAWDAVVVFFVIKRDSDGKIEEINFNFVDAEYFQKNYSLTDEIS